MKHYLLYPFVLLLLLLSLPLRVLAWDDELYKQIEQQIQAPRIGAVEYVITRYGAASGQTAALNQRAIQRAIDECSEQGGGRVVVPAGERYLTGALTLKSGVNLVVDEGARLEFDFNPSLYPVVATSWEGVDCYNLQPCIYAYDAHDIAITGKGTIDGGGSNQTWWAWCGNPKFGWQQGIPSQRMGGRQRLLKAGEDGVPMTIGAKPSVERVFTAEDAMRPQLVNFNSCQRVLLEDVTLLRSPFWVVHPLKSTDVTLRRLRIINDGPNGDGCDPESCDRVLIEDCYFSTGDDCIAIKSGRNRDGRLRAMPSQNIIIRRCEMKNGHGGVVIGSEVSGGCRNVFAHDCVMDSPDLDRVLRIKTNSCRGGVVENIHIRNIQVGQCREAVVKINLDYEPREACCRGFLPIVRNIAVERVTCQQSRYGVMIVGLDTATCVSDIRIQDCRFDGVAEGNSIRGKTRDIRFQNLFINGSLVLQQLPYGGRYSEWMVRSEMQRTPHSYLLDFSERPKWSYVMGIELEAMLDTYLRYGGQDILNYCQEYVDTMIDARGHIRNYDLQEYNLDHVRTGHFLARLYQQNSQPQLRLAMQTLMRQLDHQPRTVNDNVYWHKAIYAYQVWLDGIFMGLPYRVLAASMLAKPSKQKRIFDDAVSQIKTTYYRTLDAKTGLNRHAYDENRNMFWADSRTGLSQHCWGRAQGWFTMALVELLDVLPTDYERRQEVLALLEQDFNAILRWQDEGSGLWYQVMDEPERQGNYLESSCSCMFAYALLKASNRGWVGERFRDAGLKAYDGIVRQFIRVDTNHTISLTTGCSVAGLGPGSSPQVEAALNKLNPKATLKENLRRDGSYDYYLSEPVRDNDPKALGPFIWASLERELLEMRRVGDEMLLYQRATGGWPKNVYMSRQLSSEEQAQVVRDKQRRDDSTVDNGATTSQMKYLAQLYQQTGDIRYRDAFRRAVDYLLSGQYPNGGWPQFWPEMHGYQIHITYNDDAMVNTLRLLRDIRAQRMPYHGDLTDEVLRRRISVAFDKGIECILNTQIVTDGQLAIWCQQHDRETLLPAAARAYELPSYCPNESAGIVELLMELEQPSDRVISAVNAAMRWFEGHKLTGYRLERTAHRGTEDRDTRLVRDPQASPLWARFYDLERGEPFVCDRDGIPRRRLEQIGSERRNGYMWYGDRPARLYSRYQQWADRLQLSQRADIRLSSKGGNETGTIDWFRKPVKLAEDFDVVVHPGDSIQLAIERAPAVPEEPFKILIRKGVYRQKVIIDRPNIVLVGEDRDSTVLILAEAREKLTVSEYHGKSVGNGVITLQEGADDCIISGLTVYNNYGTAVDPGNTTHQMAIYGRATRTIVINCNVWADGNDALSLWPPGGGFSYHADLFLRCPGVDFLCPRGWCYATRCHFLGNSRAIIWHDGSNDKDKKLVIKDSYFDALSPTILGRYHHDAQFVLLNCKLSSQILDHNIRYAYADKQPDPNLWGLRAYYHQCVREGGDSGWLRNNLNQMEGAPAPHQITAQWTFHGQWDPEGRIRDLWKVLEY